jgi:hypothetical protein
MGRHAALERLDALVGQWEITNEVDGEVMGTARSTFEWTEGGRFLRQHTEGEPPPDSPWKEHWPLPATILIGLDDTSGRFTGLYADGRGVFRNYQMTLEDGVWRQWREAPGFHQRFEGTFSADGATITAHWDMSEDGSAWRKDFDLTYRKVS